MVLILIPSERDMSNLQTFECPNCGAALEVDPSGGEIIRCAYCHSRVMIPPGLRQPSPSTSVRQVKVTLTPVPPLPRRRLLFGILALPAVLILGALGVILLGAGLTLFTFQATQRAVSDLENASQSPPGSPLVFPLQASPTPAYAQELLVFGQQGSGPGYFEDPRAVAVDAAGNIYVAEYLNGRVQAFDSQGEFLIQWQVEADRPVTGMAADRAGTVYLIQGGVIHRFEDATGKALGALDFSGGNYFEDIAIAADGKIIAAWYANRDDIVVLNPDGSLVLTIPQAISGITGDAELKMNVAVDGLGNIYAMGAFNDAVFKFSPEGRYLNRFGGPGEEPGQFRALQTLAVDHYGRVFVSDSHGIQVFDENGRYPNVIKVKGVAFGLAVNNANELIVVTNQPRVIKLSVNKP